MFSLLGIGFLCGFIIAMLWPCLILHRQPNKLSSIEKLKNALLTMAVVTINKGDMDHNFNYATYDGTKFPPLSGSSSPHACFSYILNRAEFGKHMLYSKVMESKTNAIDKYLTNKFSTDDQVMDFFETFFYKCIHPVIEAESAFTD